MSTDWYTIEEETLTDDQRICVECEKPIPSHQDVKRGMDSTCYSRLFKRGHLDKHPRIYPTTQTVEFEVTSYLVAVQQPGCPSPRAICDKLGVDYDKMNGRLRRTGLGMDGKPLSKKRGQYEQIVEDYWALRANGNELTMVKIAEQIGVSDRTLYRALKEVSYEW
jgi:hypothetical protein